VITRKRWEDLSLAQQRAIAILGVLQFTLLVAALVDIWRSPEEKIQGSRITWTLVSFVNFFGPVAYFLFGRKRD